MRIWSRPFGSGFHTACSSGDHTLLRLVICSPFSPVPVVVMPSQRRPACAPQLGLTVHSSCSVQRRARRRRLEVVAEVGEQRHAVAHRGAGLEAAHALELGTADQAVVVVEQLGGLESEAQRAIADARRVVDVPVSESAASNSLRSVWTWLRDSPPLPRHSRRVPSFEAMPPLAEHAQQRVVPVGGRHGMVVGRGRVVADRLAEGAEAVRWPRDATRNGARKPKSPWFWYCARVDRCTFSRRSSAELVSSDSRVSAPLARSVSVVVVVLKLSSLPLDADSELVSVQSSLSLSLRVQLKAPTRRDRSRTGRRASGR